MSSLLNVFGPQEGMDIRASLEASCLDFLRSLVFLITSPHPQPYAINTLRLLGHSGTPSNVFPVTHLALMFVFLRWVEENYQSSL